ncbi:MAG: DUF374 domain-containing protein [Verrucomicrobia bacterium]|nr:DUF374 domain-containing protein [Verrucomicrobiota bacterium]
MSRRRSQEIRGGRRALLMGRAAGWLARIWCRTLRVEVADESGMNLRGRVGEPVVIALWHSQVFCLPPVWSRWRGTSGLVALASASKDGAVVEGALSVFGIPVVRGSSSRRGATALVALRRCMTRGFWPCITPDGPRGPRHRLQPGLVKLAQATGAAIVHAHLECPTAWRLPTWDRLVVPVPFSRVRLVLGGALRVPRVLDDAAFEAERRRIEQILLSQTEDV